MNKITRSIGRSLLTPNLAPFSSEGENISFLKMVESYFDKAGKHTNIRPDKLNFYKKPDNVVKFSLTLVRGSPFYTYRRRHHRDDPGFQVPTQNS